MDVGFGYRGELHVGGMVYLRFRDLDPVLGVPGTTTVSNQYGYAVTDPVRWLDAWGLAPGDPDFEVGTVPIVGELFDYLSCEGWNLGGLEGVEFDYWKPPGLFEPGVCFQYSLPGAQDRVLG